MKWTPEDLRRIAETDDLHISPVTTASVSFPGARSAWAFWAVRFGRREGRRASPILQMRIEQHRARLEQYEALCQQIGEEPAAVALAWLLHNPAVTAPIIGPGTKQQLTGSLRALEICLSPDTNRRLDEIWPGPGGEAPKAYAW
jgi:aryl-alcohol dehydrogenase-like predicted oxidoreductase